MRVLRKVVSVENVRNPTNGPGGSRGETLECGHRVVMKQSRRRAVRRECHECGLEAEKRERDEQG